MPEIKVRNSADRKLSVIFSEKMTRLDFEGGERAGQVARCERVLLVAQTELLALELEVLTHLTCNVTTQRNIQSRFDIPAINTMTNLLSECGERVGLGRLNACRAGGAANADELQNVTWMPERHATQRRLQNKICKIYCNNFSFRRRSSRAERAAHHRGG